MGRDRFFAGVSFASRLVVGESFTMERGTRNGQHSRKKGVVKASWLRGYR